MAELKPTTSYTHHYILSITSMIKIMITHANNQRCCWWHLTNLTRLLHKYILVKCELFCAVSQRAKLSENMRRNLKRSITEYSIYDIQYWLKKIIISYIYILPGHINVLQHTCLLYYMAFWDLASTFKSLVQLILYHYAWDL